MVVSNWNNYNVNLTNWLRCDGNRVAVEESIEYSQSRIVLGIECSERVSSFLVYGSSLSSAFIFEGRTELEVAYGRYIDSKRSYKEIKKIYFRIFGCREIRSSSVRIIQFTKCSSILWYLVRCSFRLFNGISSLQTPQIIQVLLRGYLRFYLKKLILK